jgi:hypothetical protein
VSFFDEHVRQHARPSEASAFDNLAKNAQRSIDRNDKDFEHHLDELKGKNFEILWRQDWFVVERFKWMVSSPYLFADKHRFEELAQIGTQLMRSDDIEKLRAVVAQLSMIQDWRRLRTRCSMEPTLSGDDLWRRIYGCLKGLSCRTDRKSGRSSIQETSGRFLIPMAQQYPAHASGVGAEVE